MNLLKLLEDKKGLHVESIKVGLKESFNKRHIDVDFKKAAKRAINSLRALEALKEVEVTATTGFTFVPVGDDLVSDNVYLANEIIDLHCDSEYYGLSTVSVANKRAFISKTFEVQFSIVPNYLTFIDSLIASIKADGCKKYPVVTFNDFANKSMPNGQKIGKYLARCGVSNSFIGNLDQLLQFDNGSKYLTISGATQHIVGMSYFLHDDTSCQNWDGNDSVRYALHNLAGSQCKEQYVMFLHDELDCLHYGLDEEFMLSRTTVMRQEIDGVEVFFHGKCYGNDSHLHKQLIKQFDGHFNSYEEYYNGERKLVNFSLEGGNELEVTLRDIDSLTIESNFGTSFSVTCPMCDGDGETTHNIHNRNGNRVGRVEIECRLCEGSGEMDFELDYDIDEDEATEHVSEDVLYDMFDGRYVFKFYDAHAFEGFVNNGSTIGVYVDMAKVKGYIRSMLVQDGGSFLLNAERKAIVSELVKYSNLLQVPGGENGLNALDDVTLLDKFVFVYGIRKLSESASLEKYYMDAKGLKF